MHSEENKGRDDIQGRAPKLFAQWSSNERAHSKAERIQTEANRCLESRAV